MEGLLNSKAVAATVRLTKRTTKASRKKAKATACPARTSSVRVWAGFGVVLMLVLSAALNGFANSLHAPVAWAG